MANKEVDLARLYKRARGFHDYVIQDWIHNLMTLAIRFPDWSNECMRRADYLERNLLKEPTAANVIVL